MKGGKSTADFKNFESKLSVKKKKNKREKKVKDPNKPKRPSSAFFVFMEQFRKEYKEKHPDNKSVAAVGKAGGDAWKNLSAEEKAPYVTKAEKRKEEYDTQMQAYNRRLNGEEEGSDKSKSEINDEVEDNEEEGDEDDD